MELYANAAASIILNSVFSSPSFIDKSTYTATPSYRDHMTYHYSSIQEKLHLRSMPISRDTGRMPACYNFRNGHTSAVQLLLDRGADIHVSKGWFSTFIDNTTLPPLSVTLITPSISKIECTVKMCTNLQMPSTGRQRSHLYESQNSTDRIFTG